MAAYIGFQPVDYFNVPPTWTGTDGARSITGTGFQPDIAWVKDWKAGSGNNHILFDSVRGAGGDKEVMPETDGAEGNGNTAIYGFVSSFDADGISLGAGSSNEDYTNKSGQTYMTWNWFAGTTSGISAGAQTITPSGYSINTTSKFGIYAYTGNGTAGATISHGLGAVPKAIWVKKLSAAASWQVGHAYITEGDGNDWGSAWELDTATVSSNNPGYWNDTAPTSTLVTLGDDTRCNADTATYIMYVWCDVPGMQKFGMYMGNGNARGPSVNLGFTPQTVIIKRLGAYNWVIFNEKLPGYNVSPNRLYCDTNTGEIVTDTDQIQFRPGGFTLRGSGGNTNATANNFCYFAWSQFPVVSSNDVPGVVR